MKVSAQAWTITDLATSRLVVTVAFEFAALSISPRLHPQSPQIRKRGSMTDWNDAIRRNQIKTEKTSEKLKWVKWNNLKQSEICILCICKLSSLSEILSDTQQQWKWTRMMKQPSCLRGRRWKLRHWQQSTKQVSYVLVRAMYVLKKYYERGIKFW